MAISQLGMLFYIVLSYMNKSPQEDYEKTVILAQQYLTSKDLSREITSLIATLRPKVKNNTNKMQNGWLQLEELERQNLRLKTFSEQALLDHNREIEEKMTYDKKLSEFKQEKIQAMIATIENEIKAHQHINLREEKEKRDYKTKIHLRLQQIIQKYDNDMRKKQIVIDKLAKSFAIEMDAINQLQAKFNEQEKVYTELMKERSEYIRTVWNQKLTVIQRNIAARKIQRFYRSYLALLVIHGKKGKKKGKKKK